MTDFDLKLKLEDLGHDVEAVSEASVEAFRHALAGLAKSAQAEWIRLAQARLRSSRETYINGLRQAESFTSRTVAGQDTHEIKLVGRMPNSFEFGMNTFDMKQVRPGWLGGRKAKVNQNGRRYVIIPFRHSTTSKTNLRYTGKAERANLLTELRKTVRTYGLDRMVRAASGNVVEGTVQRVPRGADVHRYLKGLSRIQKPSSNPTRGSSRLMTFRVMSEDSPEDSWIHPGLNGVNLLREVRQYVDREADRIIETIMGAA